MNLQSLLNAFTALTVAFAVVFIALVFLVVRVGRYGNVLNLLRSRLEGTGNPPSASPVPQGVPAGTGEELPPELIAVLSAAAYCMVPGGRIVSVRRAAPSARTHSLWKTAGVLENTRPF